MLLKRLFYTILLFFVSVAYAQTRQQRDAIIKNYDIGKINNLISEYSKQYKFEKEKVLQFANKNKLKIKYTEDGVTYELQRISEEGIPIYYQTYNINAAISTRTNHLHSNGSLGLNLEGQNMTAYVWDSGIARKTHQEFINEDGTSRFQASESWIEESVHSSHVTGTIIASGVDYNAKGMAPQASCVGYSWSGELSNVATEAANGMLISNHSYGDSVTQIADWYFGAYSDRSASFDEILFSAPFYSMVVAAGNAGNNDTCNELPLNGNSQYDKLTSLAVCKNTITVANAQDAEVDSDGTLTNVIINSDSSEGPTDDLRIKPDIAGNGTNVYSISSADDFSYTSSSGTSMSTPNVVGSLLLLQQHYYNINGNFMKASTLKGLALHTADDIGMMGPDAVSGWGLLNSKAAAETISNNGLETLIIERSLNYGERFSIKVESDDINKLLASISWTDPVPDYSYPAEPNSPQPVITHDLDIQVSNGTTSYPWKLTDVDANSKGNNNVDPFERVDIENATGVYEIEVTHKGFILKQDFSLVITGLDSHQLEFNSLNSMVKVCNFEDAEFEFSYLVQSGGNGSNTSFSAVGVPTEAQVSFIATEDKVTMKINGLENVPFGEYLIDVIANNEDQTNTRQVSLTIFPPTPSAPELINPVIGDRIDWEETIVFNWSNMLYATSYQIQISNDNDFQNLIHSKIVNTPEFYSSILEHNTTYYWRVKSNSMCNSSDYSITSVFSISKCTIFNVSNTPYLIPDESDNNTLSVYFDFQKEFNTRNMGIDINILHDNIGSLNINLISPSGTTVPIITSDPNCNGKNILASFKDTHSDEVYCHQSNSTGYSGDLKPVGELSSFSGEYTKGTWTLQIQNIEPEIIGSLEELSFVFCDELRNTDSKDLKIWPNPAQENFTISFKSNISEDVIINLFDFYGRRISNHYYKKTPFPIFKQSFKLKYFTKGIYTIQVINGAKVLTGKLLIP